VAIYIVDKGWQYEGRQTVGVYLSLLAAQTHYEALVEHSKIELCGEMFYLDKWDGVSGQHVECIASYVTEAY